MTTEIKSVEITKDFIVLQGIDLDKFLYCERLDEAIEPEAKHFVFDRHIYNGAQMKYLYKLVSSQKVCESEKTMAGKLTKLCGQILSIPESFLNQEIPNQKKEEPKIVKKQNRK